MAQEDCKHDGQTGTFCGLCGKQITDPDQESIKGLFRSVLDEYDLVPKKKSGSGKPPEKKATLSDKLFQKKGK